MKHFALPLMLLAVLTACASSPPPTTAKPVFEAPNGRAACQAANGQWAWPGLPGQGEPEDFEGICIVKLPDAGKACTSSSQCIGICEASDITGTRAKGVCSSTNYAGGCFTSVEDGIARAMCVD